MATYFVTTANWNDPAFWAAINESGAGHTLDFSGLPSSFQVDFWPQSNIITISNESSSFSIGDADRSDLNAQMGGSTKLDFFTFLRGGQGDDIMDGGVNNDTLEGGSGSDSLSGNQGDDVVSGGSGNDELFGGSGNDTLRGGDGDDVLQGEQGNDTYDGGAGSDTIDISDAAGSDQIDGGESAGDADKVQFLSSISVSLSFTSLENGTYGYAGGGGASGSFANIESFVGGSGQDTLNFAGLTQSVSVTYSSAGQGAVTNGTDTINFSQIESIVLTSQADVLGAGIDNVGINVDAGDGDDTVVGGSGADTISGGIGADWIRGGSGNDSIDGGGWSDSINGEGGNDSIEGGFGRDTIWGDAGNDTVDGGEGNDQVAGGTGDDVVTGGVGDDTFVYSAGGGADTITDFNAGNTGTLNDGDPSNNDSIDLSGFYDHIAELYADQADDGILNQSNTGVDYSDNDQFGGGSLTFTGASPDQTSFTAENTGVACFTSGTLISTPKGDVPIEHLQVGDLVFTLDNGPQPIGWIGVTELGPQELANAPNTRPVLISKHVLGARDDLLVSQQHGLLLGSNVLGRAKHLARQWQGVRIANGKKHVTYLHLMFDAHQIIFAQGIPCESFYPGPMAVNALQWRARQQVYDYLPALKTAKSPQDIAQIYGPTVRPFVGERAVANVCVEQENVQCANRPLPPVIQALN